VILELGYFLGSLGRARTFALKEKGVALPSDIHGVIYIELDPRNAWRLLLVREARISKPQAQTERS
jgi:predicted nucleotide-binding protein